MSVLKETKEDSEFVLDESRCYDVSKSLNKDINIVESDHEIEDDFEDEIEDYDDDRPEWIASIDTKPRLVKARLSITEIQVPTTVGSTGSERRDSNSFLSALIKKGVPVNYLPENEESTSESPIAGTIVTNEEKATESRRPSILQFFNFDKVRKSITKYDDIPETVEVAALDEPIYPPIYLSPPVVSSDNLLNSDELPKEEKQIGNNISSTKKKVRFNLSGNAFVVGEYEIFNEPILTEKKPKIKKKKKHYETKAKLNSGKSSEKYEHPHEEMYSAMVENDFGEALTEREVNRRELLRAYHEFTSFNASSNDSDSFRASKRCLKLGSKWNLPIFEVCSGMKMYIILFCLTTVIQSMFHSYRLTIMNTFQRRFHLTELTSGLILTSSDIFQILVSVLIGFYGRDPEKRRWYLKRAFLCSAFAAFFAATPHFIYGSGEFATTILQNPTTEVPQSWLQKKSTSPELCGLRKIERCFNKSQPEKMSLLLPVILSLSSQFLLGISNIIFWSVGVAALDDTTTKRLSPIPFGFFSIARVIGPNLGSILGGKCLAYWINPLEKSATGIKILKWIGAWWLGYVLLLFLISLLGFCVILLSNDKKRPWDDNETPLQDLRPPVMQESEKFLEEKPCINTKTRKNTFTELKQRMRLLLRNKIWVANALSNMFFVMAMNIYWTLKPKYLQTQFRKTTLDVDFYTGTTTMGAYVLGILISMGILISCKPRTKYITAYNVLLSTYAFCSLFILMSVYCPSIEIAGHVPGNQEKWVCSDHCKCTEIFAPICANDGLTTFYSACYAGCTGVNTSATPNEFTNCSCMVVEQIEDNQNLKSQQDQKVSSFPVNTGWALEGFCPSSCNALSTYLMIHLVNKVIFSTGKISGTLINIRSVEEGDKTLALGCLAGLIAFAGILPLSYVMNYILDAACLAWNEECGAKLSCSLYDADIFRIALHCVPAALLVISIIADIIVHQNSFSLKIFEKRKRSHLERC